MNITQSIDIINNNKQKSFAIFIFIMYSVGIIGHLMADTRSIMISLTPYILWFLFLLTLYLAKPSRNILIWVIFAGVFGWGIEAFGTATGLIFGDYTYGNTLGLKILAAPILIGVNWITVILGINYWVDKYLDKLQFILKVIIISCLAVAFDYILEPVAISLDYWSWPKTIDPPLENYIGWFFVSMILSISLYISRKYLKVEQTNYFWGYLIIGQLFFFTFLNFFL